MKRFFFILALAVCLAVPGMSSAETNGVYVAPKFLMSFMNTGNVSSELSYGGVGFSDDNSYSQFTLGGGLAVGYDFYPKCNVPVRAEVEFLMRGNQKDTFDVLNNKAELKGTWNTSTLFANFYYDFHNSSDFTPYVGAGAGLAFNYAGYTGKIKNYAGSISEEQYSTNFAWNVGAGCSYAFTENISVDVAYRFMMAGNNSLDGNRGGYHYSIDNNPYGHEFTIGARFTF